MFRKATAIASGFTRPVVLSRLSNEDQCSSSIGSYIVLNNQGWILTAGHIIDQIMQMHAEEQATLAYTTQRDAIKADSKLSSSQKHQQLRNLNKPLPETTKRWNAWWGQDNLQIGPVYSLHGVDLGMAQIQNFDPTSVSSFPIIKDPDKEYETGTSLCKLGFPFHVINPTYDTAKNLFVFPPGALPLPFFPLEGMYTRTVLVEVQGIVPPPYPLLWIETSTPGLRGQSGGPIFDTQGSIWAIQSNTAHYDLGFEAIVQTGKKKEKERQFLNIGRGVHAKTIVEFLNAQGVRYQKSTY